MAGAHAHMSIRTRALIAYAQYMNQESLKYSRLVRIDYQVRTIAFIALYVAIGMHVSGQGYGAAAWIALVLQFLVLPHLIFWRARKAENSRQAERTNLT